MRSRPIVSAAFAALVVAPPTLAGAATTPPQANDQVWTEVDVSAPLGPATITVMGVARLGDGQPNPTLSGAGLTADLPVGRGFSLTAGDIWAWIRVPETGQTIYVQLPLAAVSYAWTWGGFHFSDRNRIEDILYVPGLNWRYRNRLAVDHSLKLGPVRSVFASDEAFYDVAHSEWSRNRAQLGFTLASVGPTAMQIYYLRQDDREERPGVINALGATLKIVLR